MCLCVCVRVSSVPSSCKEQWPGFVQPSFTRQLLHKRLSVSKTLFIAPSFQSHLHKIYDWLLMVTTGKSKPTVESILDHVL